MNSFINHFQKNTRGHIFTINVGQLVYFCIFLKAYCCFVRIKKYIVLSALHLNISIYVVVRLSPGIVLRFATGPGFNSQQRQLFFFPFFLSFLLKC